MKVKAESHMEPSLGTGVYTFTEAAKLLQIHRQRLVRWVDGYVYPRKDGQAISAPVLTRSNSPDGLLTFHDLVELFFVREYRKAGVDLPQIRAAADQLRRDWGTPYPFASKRIVEIERTLVDADEMKEVLSRQTVFGFAREFFKNFDFDREGLAEVWHPLGKGKLVVLDPKRSFGAPIELRSGIRTEVLYRQFRAENDLQAVADWYEVPVEAVQQAVQFEEQWAKAA